MKISLAPFPDFLRPENGTVTELPITRDGVSAVSPGALQRSGPNRFAELRMRDKRTGRETLAICGLLPAPAFLDRTVRPHEQTLRPRLERQRQLVQANHGALGKPVLVVAEDLCGVLKELHQNWTREAASVRYEDEHNHYELTEFSAASAAVRPELDLSQAGQLAIADGHHRAETHARLAAEGNVDCALIPVCLTDVSSPSIGIFLRCLDDFDAPAAQLLDLLSPYFTCVEMSVADIPKSNRHWLMTYAGRHYELTRRHGSESANAWFVNTILKNVFCVDDVCNDPRLLHRPVDADEAGRLIIKDKQSLSFAARPVSPEAFVAEVKRGHIFPPKSTRFMPRVPSGLVVWPAGLR